MGDPVEQPVAQHERGNDDRAATIAGQGAVDQRRGERPAQAGRETVRVRHVLEHQRRRREVAGSIRARSKALCYAVLAERWESGESLDEWSRRLRAETAHRVNLGNDQHAD